MNKSDEKQFKPYIPADKILPEFTALSTIIGVFVVVIFGAANAYLGLKVGMTISASIPSSVIAIGIIRGVMHKNSILESNIVQTLGSIGVSIASAIVFVVPAMYMWAEEWHEPFPSFLKLFFISITGGFLGIIFMIPLRKALIVKEHETLPYPEGTACAEVLLAGEQGGASAAPVFKGFGIAAGFKLISDGLQLFPTTVSMSTNKFGLPGGGIASNILPALIGVGYICGYKISAVLLTGSALGWLVILPLLAFFGGDSVIYPGTVPINQMAPSDLWGNYLRYIGAGAVAMGGIISLAKSLPMIYSTFKKSFKSFGQKTEQIRTDQDISPIMMISIFIIMFLIIWALPVLKINLLGTVLIVIFGFLFATVSSRAVGLVGVSNSPTSGMIIAALLVITLIFKQTGIVGHEGMMTVITIGAIICVIISIAGDTSQDLKTGYLVGATPKKQQLSEMVGVVVMAAVIGFIMYLFYMAWGFGGINLPAPQATLLKLIVEGIMSGNLPWTLFLIGAFIAIIIELLGLPTLVFAVGLYLPIEVNMGVFIGGVIKLIFEKTKRSEDTKIKGVLYCSGLIAGEGIIGVLLAGFAAIPFKGGTFADFIDISSFLNFGVVGSLIGLAFLIFTIFWASKSDKKVENEEKTRV